MLERPGQVWHLTYFVKISLNLKLQINRPMYTLRYIQRGRPFSIVLDIDICVFDELKRQRAYKKGGGVFFSINTLSLTCLIILH